MSFDISNLHIADGSPEGQVVEAIISRDHVSPEEAVRRALRQLALPGRSPAEQMWGAFSSPEDSAMLDEIVAEAYERRLADQPRDLGL